MTRILGLVLLVAIAVATISFWPRFTSTVSEAPIDPTVVEPEIYMLDATIREFDDAGQLRYQLFAKRLDHYPDTQVTELTEPVLLLERPGEPTWRVSANTGNVRYSADNDSEFIALRQDVVLERGASLAVIGSSDVETGSARVQAAASTIGSATMADSGSAPTATTSRALRIESEAMDVEPTPRIARSNVDVLIISESARSTGAGMTANLTTGQMTLLSSPNLRVQTIVQPKPSPATP